LINSLAQAIRADADLVKRTIESCRRQAEGLQRPDATMLERQHQAEQKLTQQIKFIMAAPGETEQDQDENQSVLANLRRQRAVVQAEMQRLQALAGREIKIPSVDEVGALLDQLADVLMQAVGSSDDGKVAAARRIVQAMTGGRIVISQQGEPLAKRGWLRATFKLNLLAPALYALGAGFMEGDRDIVVDIDIRKPTDAEAMADEAKALMDTGMLEKEIAVKLSQVHGRKIGRNMVAKALKHWFSSRGLQAPDGRKRRKTLARKSIQPNLAAQIADRAMELIGQRHLYTDVAEQLHVDRNTLTAAIKHWHVSRNLPVPDGRTRRRSLEHKSRPRHVRSDGGTPDKPIEGATGS
jgi:hypothetical protein